LGVFGNVLEGDSCLPHHSTLNQSSILQNDPIDFSFVIPIFDEESTIGFMYENIVGTLEKMGTHAFEVIFIDDGSHDDSWEKIKKLIERYPDQVIGVRSRRNFGKAHALSIGFKKSRGRIVFTMDGDLQDDAIEIPRFLEKLDEGYDMVTGWKYHRNDPLSKTIPSKVFNFVTRAFSGLELHDFNCGYKAYRREAIEHLNLYGDLHRYIPILVHAEGFTIAEIAVTHNPRKFGKSKYGWKRLYKGFLDLLTVIALTRYAKRPAHIFGGSGLIVGAFGFSILSYLSVMKICFDQGIGGRPLFFLGILAMLLAAQLIGLGLIGELIIKHRNAK